MNYVLSKSTFLFFFCAPGPQRCLTRIRRHCLNKGSHCPTPRDLFHLPLVVPSAPAIHGPSLLIPRSRARTLPNLTLCLHAIYCLKMKRKRTRTGPPSLVQTRARTTAAIGKVPNNPKPYTLNPIPTASHPSPETSPICLT